MSQQAIVSPEELERFALNLKQFNAQLGEKVSQLQGQFRQLGQTWRDQEHQKFAQEFEQAMSVIQRFMKTADAHAPFLLRKAQRAKEFLQQR